MGDMKTPDFDDLLAAFDIPDMVDPKAAIESGHDDLKPGAPQEDEALSVSPAPDVGVSVIVKNVRSMDAGEHAQLEKEAHSHAAVGNGLHNGFLATSPSERYGMNGGAKPSPREGGHALAGSNPSSFNQFSPISSAEEFDDDDKIEVDDPVDMPNSQTFFSPAPNPLRAPPTRREEHAPKPSSKDGVAKRATNGDCRPSKTDQNNNNKATALGSVGLYDSPTPRRAEEHAKEPAATPLEAREAGDHPGHVAAAAPALSQAKAKSAAKLSSCIAAIAALSAKKATAESGASESPAPPQKESLAPQRASPEEAPESPKAPEQESAGAAARGSLASGEPDSPSSVTSEGSSRGSPSTPTASSPTGSTPTGSTPVIPKVRIKTIKTSSGQIKRTVTRVLPEVDPDGLKRGEGGGGGASSVAASSVHASTTPLSAFPAAQASAAAGPAAEIAKQVTIKPVATAFLPVAAVKAAGSQVISLKLANNTTVKATVIPAAAVQSAGGAALLKASGALQQQVASLAGAKLVPKTVHLTGLSLRPQAAAAAELHRVLAKPQQPVKQATPLQAQAPKKVSRVQVLASSQSSVVEAFNKVLSSINPVPPYVPNLSPPSAARISLPPRGYRCLECGDSFALEGSLGQHYDRRSVRIEVTCNHCARNLVFYNKCSLLSHARGHKDKGVVMQCSHLILKPIPADQMITASPPPPACPAPQAAQVLAGQPPGKGAHTAVISAPSSAPLVAAMPLEEDASRLCRHGLKCLECNEMFQEENALAMHYQQAAESSGQKTCTICQMLLPNHCSFASHQRIHQHKSPYICPECGAICRSVHFQSHVTKSCLHYTRRVGYRCVHCSVIYADIAALKAHIQSAHCEIFYKCPICPMAFKSAPGTHSHGHTQHPGVKVGEPKLIYKCSMCDTVFTQQSLLYAHFDQHISSQKVSVFKCPDCSMHYAQKQLMLDHIKAMHGTLKTVEGPPNLGINLPLSAKPTNHIKAMHGTLKTVEGPPNLGINLPLSAKPTNPPAASPGNREGGALNGLDRGDRKPPPSPVKKGGSAAPASRTPPAPPRWRCADCDRVFTQREAFVAHVRREHGKQLKKHPCHQCDKSFSSSHSLCRHTHIKHKGQRKAYSCPHCPDLSQSFSKRLMLDRHVQLMHGVKDPEGKNGPDNAQDTPDKDPSQAPSPKTKQEDDEGSPGLRSRGPEEAPPLKKLKVNVFKVHKCAVCGFASEEVVTFRAHLPQHKTDGSSFQCRECGLCYTSQPSLSRHLFIVHRLREPHGLARRRGPPDAADANDDDDESQRENQRGAGTGVDGGAPETKCKVCGKRFDTEAGLNTHMRTHGMAFIKSKRLSATEK